MNINKILKKIKRVALHSYKLTFLHPSKKKKTTIIAPLPQDFQNAVNLIENKND